MNVAAIYVIISQIKHVNPASRDLLAVASHIYPFMKDFHESVAVAANGSEWAASTNLWWCSE
jgi:hypothetical protein